MVKKTIKKQAWPFIGHDELGRQLINLEDTKRLPQVILMVGPRAVGKSSAARWLSTRSLCRSNGVRPCGVCSACRQSASNQHPNCTVIDPAIDTSIGIEEIRVAISEYQLISWGQVTRWLVIVDAERLTEAAANTMLKFLEEIPNYVNVILTSSEPQRILPTLKSRATIYQWHLVSSANVQLATQSNHRLVARSAGRPGWMKVFSTETALDEDEIEARSMIGQFVTTGMTPRPQLKERLQFEKKVQQEELVVRELLLRSVQSGRRLLWPGLTDTLALMTDSSIGLTKKYLERYELSPNLQSRLLYEDLHLV